VHQIRIKATNLGKTAKNAFGKFINSTGTQPPTELCSFVICDLLVLDKVILFLCYEEELQKY
jgi:hypothetical protein